MNGISLERLESRGPILLRFLGLISESKKKWQKIFGLNFGAAKSFLFKSDVILLDEEKEYLSRKNIRLF